ncbi:hypoxia inducible factor 1 subunit alpha, like [Neoarius graeffei]|uniref:hypoxia inducible factor 1 subunit alpha, like n=1 Tax=Neoarius graeffei TaxID=443677 RepID=UPI00298C7593|nr:hypoxia inducible factor 1 subunit alpha, like [Neoarius graeffei]
MTTTVAKRPSSEQRKVRLRDAARCRRSQETEVFYELARSLPLSRRITSHLDKAGIMRVTLSYLRMHHLLHSSSTKAPAAVEKEEDPTDPFYQQALAGFILVLSEDGDMVFLSDNVSKFVGITQLELLGQCVYDYVHPCDQEELRDLLTTKPGLLKKKSENCRECNFFLRLKSTLTNHGKTVNIKSATWKVVHCTGFMKTLNGEGEGEGLSPAGCYMTLLCEPIPHPGCMEFPLDRSTFVTRHNMDLHFNQCDGRVTELVGYLPDDLIGRSAYDFFHALDFDHLTRSLHVLLSKGQVCTSRYRFLVKNGGFVWTETQATVLYNKKTSQPESVVCLNFVLSAVEEADTVFSIEQTRTEVAQDKPTVIEVEDSEDEMSSSSSSSSGELEPEDLLQLAPAPGDPTIPPTEHSELFFGPPPSPNTVPKCPKELCTPKLRQLLSPIFDSPSSPDLSSGDEVLMDTGEVEKFFASKPEETQKRPIEDMDDTDLDMLAPYISMDEDFQLTFLSQLPEAEKQTAEVPTTASKKRGLEEEEDVLSQTSNWEKRRKNCPIEEEFLLSHTSLMDLQAASGLEELEPKRWKLSQLLTDRDPVLGGTPALCDAAAVMTDSFSSQPPDLMARLSGTTSSLA